ncbi:hypothetical protein MUN81_06405 [Hymenobacter sp. 5317J-9]|uniref:hypothetical protein n=1 Tax=Hymenobacter sp. 5317J-9 TaxID=2932250 RepID=UPI001FD6A8FB|nr:hypothetical protein [Hymenobacter sp. 5317J-9]UOQ99120.1 hypothetical protein MUN81_06405 [Hymenobacter sp. 5317J-9]
MAASSEETAARAFLDDEQVVLTRGNQEVVRIPVQAIKLIGEYTNANGPIADDWFIVFMTAAKEWKQISHYTPGMLEMLQELSLYLKSPLIGSLAYSTSWKTNIIWPPTVAEQEMWDVISDEPATLFGKLKRALGFADQQLVLTAAAASVFV